MGSVGCPQARSPAYLTNRRIKCPRNLSSMPGSSDKPDSKTQLYISNLPVGSTSKRLEDAFASFGEITDAFIPHRGSRFGFVDFKEPAAATKALKEMHDKHLDDQSKKDAGEPIGVIRAKERPSDKE